MLNSYWSKAIKLNSYWFRVIKLNSCWSKATILNSHRSKAIKLNSYWSKAINLNSYWSRVIKLNSYWSKAIKLNSYWSRVIMLNFCWLELSNSTPIGLLELLKLTQISLELLKSTLIDSTNFCVKNKMYFKISLAQTRCKYNVFFFSSLASTQEFQTNISINSQNALPFGNS